MKLAEKPENILQETYQMHLKIECPDGQKILLNLFKKRTSTELL